MPTRKVIFSSLNRNLLQCPLEIKTNAYSNCTVINLPSNSNSGSEPKDNPNFLRNKLILFYQNQLLVGNTCTNNTDTSFQCCDSILLGNPETPPISFYLNMIDPCNKDPSSFS